MQHGEQRNVRLCWPLHEAARRYEPVAALDQLLADAGIEAAHWSTLGADNAPDSQIMAYARAND